MSLRWLKAALVLSFVYSLAFTATAQNYYPAEVGNTWVLADDDGKERRTYSLEGPETIDGRELITLKLETEELSTGDLDTDKYFLSVGSEAVKLHRTVLQEAGIEVKTTFGLTVSGNNTTNLEVVGFEDLETPAGTFQNCAKVELALKFSAAGVININATTYQWLAPDVGPVQYENSEGLISKLVDYNLITKPEPNPSDVNADGVVNILDLTFVASRFGEMAPEADVTGDGVVNILDLVRVAQNFGN